MLESLARVVLPEEILNSFEIKDVVRTSSEIHIYLDELIPEKMRGNPNYESKGFMSATSVTDFPIRDHKVILVIRRRRWTDVRDGSSFTLPLEEIAASGTRLSKEFASFLKETYGRVPRDLPFA